MTNKALFVDLPNFYSHLGNMLALTEVALDMLNGAYHYMDLAPKGRDEDALPYSMAWLRRHNQYNDGNDVK